MKILSLSAAVLGLLFIAFIMYFGVLSMYAAYPTGEYHVDTGDRFDGRTENTLVASVYQDMRFAPDREIYRGPPNMAWQLYFKLTAPSARNYTADLPPKDVHLQWTLSNGR